MAEKKQKTNYQIKVDEIKKILTTLEFEDLKRLRKNCDSLFRNELQKRWKREDARIERQRKELDNLKAELFAEKAEK